MSPQLAKDPSFNFAHIGMDMFSFSFFKKICLQHLDDFSYHIAKKRVPYIDHKGNRVIPDHHNGIKLELFLFDCFPFAESYGIFEVQRVNEFCPLKNMDKNDSPETCRVMVENLYNRLLLAPPLFISDLNLHDVSELIPRLKPEPFIYPLLLATSQQLSFLDSEHTGRSQPENIIHSEAGASQFGFKKALVGGVTVLSWTIGCILKVFGDQWLDEGWLEVDFIRPVFPDMVMTTSVIRVELYHFQLQMKDSDGRLCLSGRVGMGLPDWLSTLQIPEKYKTSLEPDQFPSARRLTLEVAPALVGEELLPRQDFLSHAHANFYRKHFVHTENKLFSEMPFFIHPGFITGRMTKGLNHTIFHLPAIHTRTKLKNWTRIPSGQSLLTALKFKDAYQKKGMGYAVLDGVVVARRVASAAARAEIVSQLEHTTIFHIRKSKL